MLSPSKDPSPKSPPALLPAPKRFRTHPGSFGLRPTVPIVLSPGADDSDFATAVALRDGIAARCGLAVSIEVHSRTDGLGARIELQRKALEQPTQRALLPDALGGDDHQLTVEADRVTLVGAGPAGLRYAVESLLQLIGSNARIPACAIDDSPDFKLRGVMLDVSRGKVPTLTTLKKLVDVCVRLKLNALMLYIEHTFQFRRHPEIGRGASPLDATTLLELDTYAAARHVELIPSLQSLGHMEHILNLPAYAGLAETDRRWTISPAEPGTYRLLDDLLCEFLPLFRSHWFNANCDEPFDLEAGKSAQRGRQLGPGGVYLEHVERVRDLARKHGKRTMIWGDVVHARPERIAEIDRDLVLLDWWYEADFDFDRVERFAENQIEFAVCPGTSSWNCLFPRIDNSLENISGYSAAGKRHGALGLIVTDWGDFGHYNLQGGSWFGYAWAAQHAWSGAVGPRDFDRAFSNALFGDRTGTVARCYREIGAIHEAGFRVFNASALQFLYFDNLERGYFIEGTKPAVLRRSERKLQQASSRLDSARERFSNDDLTWRELRLAVDESLLAIRKGQLGGDYIGWRRQPRRLGSRDRRRLAVELTALAKQQTALGRRLRALWLERSEPSNFEITGRRLQRSVRSLRRAARALEVNRPPAAPEAHPGFGGAAVFAALRESAAS